MGSVLTRAVTRGRGGERQRRCTVIGVSTGGAAGGVGVERELVEIFSSLRIDRCEPACCCTALLWPRLQCALLLLHPCDAFSHVRLPASRARPGPRAPLRSPPALRGAHAPALSLGGARDIPAAPAAAAAPPLPNISPRAHSPRSPLR